MAIYELTIKGTLGGQAVNNVYKYQTGAVIFGVTGFVNNWALGFKTAYQPAAADNVLMSSVHVRRLDAVEPGFDVIPSSWPFNGTNVGQYMSTFYAVRVSFTGAILMFPYHGSKRYAGATESAFDDGSLNAAGVLLWQEVAEWSLNTYAGDFGETWQHVLYTTRYPTPNVVGTVTLTALGSTQNTRKVGSGG